MQRLNIQLSRHIQTTRRPRWVVWLLPIFFLFVGFAAYSISSLWFTRDAIYEAAPKDAVVAARFFTGGSKTQQIDPVFENVPLISNRSITFQDLQPFTQGEFVIFWNQDGKQSVAIRTNPATLPQSLLDAEHISQKIVSKNIVLLSENSVDTAKFPLKTKFFPPLSWPGRSWVGEVAFRDEPKRGYIFNTKDRFEISLPEKIKSSGFNGIPDKTFAFISTNGAGSAGNDSLLTPFLPLIGPVLDDSFRTYFDQLTDKTAKTFLTKDDSGIGFLLVTNVAAGEKTPDIDKLLQTLNSLNAPKIIKTPLPDGTDMQEIISDPNSVSAELVTVYGVQMHRIVTNQQEILAGLTPEHELILTNREELLKFYREKRSGQDIHTLCGGSAIGLNISAMNNLSDSKQTFTQPTPFSQILEHFSALGVSDNMFSTQLNLCK